MSLEFLAIFIIAVVFTIWLIRQLPNPAPLPNQPAPRYSVTDILVFIVVVVALIYMLGYLFGAPLAIYPHRALFRY